MLVVSPFFFFYEGKKNKLFLCCVTYGSYTFKLSVYGYVHNKNKWYLAYIVFLISNNKVNISVLLTLGIRYAYCI